MKGFLTPYLLFLCLLVLSGYSKLPTHAGRGCQQFSITGTEKAECVSVGDWDDDFTSVSETPASEREKHLFKVHDVEGVEEEDEGPEGLSLKRRSGVAAFVIAIVAPLSHSVFESSIAGMLHFLRHPTCITSNYRYLIIQVLRN